MVRISWLCPESYGFLDLASLVLGRDHLVSGYCEGMSENRRWLVYLACFSCVFSSCLHLERVDAPYCSFIVLNMFGIVDSVECSMHII